MSFAHLHLHTEFSLLDGACRIQDLPKRVKELGQSAVAITDHGVMYGVIDFYKACKKEGVKPIIGCEVYVAPRSRTQRVAELDGARRHLVLLCRNEEGYRNLCVLVSRGFTEGFYTKPRVDMELLRQYNGGLIALSACLAGEIPRRIMGNDYQGAKAHALEMREIFGEDGYYLEVQDQFIESQKMVNQEIYRLSEETGIPLVATNDAHYLKREDSVVQDILMCVQMGKTLNDPTRMKFPGDEFYVKSEEEMRALFPHHPEAIENTQKIADLCNLEFVFGEHHLPQFQLPLPYQDSEEYFRMLCLQGFEKRYPDQNHRDRLEMELDMISKMGFVDYFLIVADFISYAKQNDIPVGPGRGSAAGSMVSYCLEITDVDPMEYSLYFERFLNPERVSMPDIDIDFCVKGRGEVISYVNEKYGADRVSQIVTFGTMAARGSLRDVGRVMDIPLPVVDKLAKMVPPPPVNASLKETLVLSREFKEMYESDPEIKKLVDTAQAIEGMPRNASTHAAGVVITKNPVHNYVPLAKNVSKGIDSVVTQYGMITLEELGLLKMDFLGLRNLTVLHEASKTIKRSHSDFSIDGIGMNDPVTMQMISDGKTSGVFQMESAGMTSVCVKLRPKDIEDVTAIIALYRPGPMESIPRFIECKHHPEKITYHHPSLEPILSVTYGCIVYQEQVIEIFRRLAGYSLGQADVMRRAISKKKESEIVKERQSFLSGDPERSIAGCGAIGISEKIAVAIFEEILDFASYAFNKAHAVCYAVVAYQTAYFKCHYPKEYLAALLTSVLDDTDKMIGYIAECRDMGIPLLPPDINRSGADFTASEDGIRFGLVAIKGVGRGIIDRVFHERESHGEFHDFLDFCDRMHGNELNRSTVESLIRCGTFDGLGHRRSQLLEVFSQVLEGIATTRKKNLEGQIDLFGGGAPSEGTPLPRLELPDIPEFSLQELMAMEKSTTGLYLSGHPMDGYRNFIKRCGAVSVGSVLSNFENNESLYQDNQVLTLAGIIANFKTITTRNNATMAYVTLEDDTANLEVVVFPRTLQQFGAQIYVGNMVLIRGKISVRDNKPPQLLSDHVERLVATEDTPSEFAGKKLYLRFESDNKPIVSKCKAILSMFVGNDDVVLYFEDTKLRLGGHCEITTVLFDQLTEVLGTANVVIK
ncbi:MAG: DNA polymerase III subunit alpha [Eubacteriales bacterium]